MNKDLPIAIIAAAVSFLFYRFHLWWRKGLDSNESIHRTSIEAGTIKHWVMIIFTALIAVVYFLKSIF